MENQTNLPGFPLRCGFGDCPNDAVRGLRHKKYREAWINVCPRCLEIMTGVVWEKEVVEVKDTSE